MSDLRTTDRLVQAAKAAALASTTASTDPADVQAAIDAAIDAARPAPPPAPPAPANVIAMKDGHSVDFTLTRSTTVHIHFEKLGLPGDLPEALPDGGFGRIGACDRVGFPAVLQLTAVEQDPDSTTPVPLPPPVAVRQDTAIQLDAGPYKLSLQDGRTCRFFVIGVQGV